MKTLLTTSLTAIVLTSCFNTDAAYQTASDDPDTDYLKYYNESIEDTDNNIRDIDFKKKKEFIITKGKYKIPDKDSLFSKMIEHELEDIYQENTGRKKGNQPCGSSPRYDYIRNSEGKLLRVDRGGRVGPYTDQEIRDLRRQNPNYIISVDDRIVR